MADLSVADVPGDLEDAGRFAAVALCAIAREEALGRRPRRLLEDGHATWHQFRGRLGAVDFVELLLEDAAVTQPFAFDAQALLGPAAAGIGKLPLGQVQRWMDLLAEQYSGAGAAGTGGGTADSSDYIADQAQRLELPSRLARSELHTGVRAHHRVLELPGTGGQLALYLVEHVEGIYLQDVFTIAWESWRDRMLAGLVAVENGLTGRAPVAPEPGLEYALARSGQYDYVIGARPERGVQPYEEAELLSRFPDAVVVLV